MHRVWDTIAWVVVGIGWFRDRHLCEWSNATHMPQDNER